MASSAGGKGKSSPGKAKGGAKRHKKVFRDNLKGVTKPALRRLARRGGVKRISAGVYEDARALVRTFIESVVYYSLLYKSSHGRKTIGLKDVVFALKRRGSAFIGGEQYQRTKKSKGKKAKKA